MSVLALPAHRRFLLPIVGAACLVTSAQFRRPTSLRAKPERMLFRPAHFE